MIAQGEEGSCTEEEEEEWGEDDKELDGDRNGAQGENAYEQAMLLR